MPFVSDEQWKTMLTYARRQFVYDLLLGGLFHAREIWERMELIGITKIPRTVISLRIENYYSLTYAKSERWKHLLKEDILKSLDHLLPEDILVAPFADNLIVMLAHITSTSKGEERELISQFLAEWSTSLMNQFSAKVLFGVGSVYNDPRLLHFSFQESIQTFNQARELEENILFADNNETEQKNLQSNYKENALVATPLNWQNQTARSVARCLFQGNLNGVIAQLQNGLEQRLNMVERSKQERYQIIAVLELGFAVLRETFPEHITELCLEEFPLLLAEKNHDDLKLWLSNFGERLIHWVERYGTRENPQVATVKAYVEDHISGDISLKNVSEIVHLAPTYLSQLFKKVTGESFSEYVSGQRLNKACQLLQNTSLAVREVASQVGFQDVNYFARAFKQRYGLTPLEFRKGK